MKSAIGVFRRGPQFGTNADLAYPDKVTTTDGETRNLSLFVDQSSGGTPILFVARDATSGRDVTNRLSRADESAIWRWVGDVCGGGR